MRVCPTCGVETTERACPRDGTPTLDGAAFESDDLVGRVFDERYEIIERIGQGGMGSVYSARQISVGRPVAVKVLNSELSRDRDAASRFVREARVASRLNHPNSIVVHDFGHCREGLFLVMELLEGETLREHLDRTGPMPPREAARVALRVVEALGAAHEIGVIHRDLKPANIFLQSVPMLAPFVYTVF